MYTITKAVLRGEVTPPPHKPERAQMHIHPRRKRVMECSCGYPCTPCVLGKKFDPDDTTAYRGNYCAVEDRT